jgi:hypothetical protein
MQKYDQLYPKVRVTKQARAHLEVLVPAIREKRGLNVSMTDLVSEAILSIPIPQPESKKAKQARAPKASASV